MSQQLLHTIRLAGPWEFQIGRGTDDWTTIKLPAEWRAIVESLGMVGRESEEPAHFRGAKGDVLARRRFQRPTGLDVGMQVWVVMPVPDHAVAGLWFNGSAKPLAKCAHPQGTAFDITDLLQSSNVVTIEFDIDRLMTDDENREGEAPADPAPGINVATSCDSAGASPSRLDAWDLKPGSTFSGALIEIRTADAASE